MTTTQSGPAQEYRTRLVEALRTIERLQDRLKKANDRPQRLSEPIAIVGLGCRLPGGADSPEAFWRVLRDGVDTTSEFPAERGDASALYDPDPDAPGKAYVIRGAFLGRVDTFEPSVFGISPREALGMDPQQRITLEVAWEALERAGYAPDSLSGSATGVYLGLSTTDYVRMRQSEGDIRDVDAYQLVGEPSFAAGRISYTLGLQGPSKVMDTTCSSSLVALHEACQGLRLGECDMALAGGVNLMLSPYGFVMMSKFAGLSPEGRCKTFDASADGYARGEGCGVVVLKRYSDALRDGDNVIALVRGTAVNHDGRSSGLTVPNPAAQQDVIRAALAQAGIAPGDVDYVEAHGTGTALGDPIELRALEAVIGRNRPAGSPLLVGSVKTNIGHLESAAGVAGLLKLVLALQHGQIPPHLHFTDPNPNVDWSRLHIEVTAQGRPWPTSDRPAIGAISSFGASGTNAHAVVSAPPAPAGNGQNGVTRDVLVLSANTEESLTELARKYALHLRREPDLTLGDACHTTQVGRSRQSYGLAVAGDSLDSLADALDAHLRGGRDPRVDTARLPVHKYRKTGWLFTGQGAQYAQMARGLADEPAFREAFDACAELFDPLLGRSLASVVWPEPGTESPIDDTRYTQPALFAVEYALARMWLGWGLKPSALLGHSIGELAAACIAGVFSLPDAVRLVAARASLMADLPAGGAMAAVHCDEATARRAIADHPDTLSLAAVNGPHTVTVSGVAADLDAVLATLKEQGVRSQRLTVSHAFHSPLLRPMLDEFRRVAGTITYAAPTIPLYSNVTGQLWTAAEVGPEYWVRHAAGAVRFHDGITGLHASGVRTFLEVGPAPVLVGMGSRAVEDPDCTWIASLRRPTRKGASLHDQDSVRQALGLLYLRGGTVDWAAVHAGQNPRRVPLPTAVWRGDSYWFAERRKDAEAAPAPRAGTVVPSIGLRLHSAVPTYEVNLDDARWEPYARQATDGRSYLPVGALAAVMQDAVADAFGGRWDCLEELIIDQRIPRDGDGRIVQITLRSTSDGHATFEWHSITPDEEAAGAPWKLHGHGLLRRRASGRRLAPELQVHRYGDAVSYEPAALSSALAGAVTGASRGGGGVLVALAPERAEGGLSWVEIVDAAVAALSWDAGVDTQEVGFTRRVSDLICEDPRRVAYVRATAHRTTGTSEHLHEVLGGAEFFAEDGAHIGSIGELLVVGNKAAPAQSAPWRHPDELLQRVEWQVAPAPPSPGRLDDENWLLVPDRDGVADRLAEELRRRGARCLVAAPDVAGTDRAAVTELLARWRDQSVPTDTADRIVLLTGLDAPEPEAADAEALVEYRDRTELTVVSLVQGLLAREDCAKATVSFVTRGTMPAQRARGDVSSPFGNTLWGLGRVVALEHPEHWGGAVDLDPAGPLTDDVARLADALLDVRAEDQQALRGDTRYVARLVPHSVTQEELRSTPPVRSSASYLITGAFGGIGRALSRWLAINGAGKLVLVGRTPLPPRADWDMPGLSQAVRERIDLVRELEATGALVEVAAADVCDPAQLLPVMEDLAVDSRPLAGVVHAAGLSVPQFLRDITVETPDDYDAVWRPKVVGGWLLHQLTEGAELDFFLGFSSIAATWGSQHLSSYSASNAFLDGLAEYRRGLGQAALTVSWGPWELESNLFGEDVLAFLMSTGLRTLSAPQCLKLLGALLLGSEPQAVVCAADWATYKPVMEARIERPLLRTLQIVEDFGDDAGSPVLEEIGRAAGPRERVERLVGYLRDVLGDVLSVSADAIEPEADVMSHGLDSLMVMEVVKRCKKDLRVSVRPNHLFERSTLVDWADLLSGELGGAGDDDSAAAEPTEAVMADPANIAEDVSLAPDIVPEGPLRDGYQDPRQVLLTGATGFLGAYLLDELLATTEATVHCLVRCQDPADGLARIRANYEKYLPWRTESEDRISVLPGDLEKPLLGLPDEQFDTLAHELDAIYHNGAWVNFTYTYEQLRAANLAGCEEILRLACRGPLTPVNHMSTYGIWGLPADGRTVIRETDDITGAGKLVTGYVQTKWAAERLMEIGRSRGIPVDIHRPGRVLGDSRTGAALTTHFTTRVIKGCIQLGIAPALDLEIEMTPVDYVVRSLVRISREPHAFGETYHLVNGRKMTFERLIRAITGYGWKVEVVPVDTWWGTLQDSYAEQDNELHPVMEVVEEFVVGGEEAIDYDDSNAERVLKGTGISCPPLDEALLGTYFDWMVRSGYLPEPRG
ncbi:polyketide synthase [Wenjunlia vitaminophila]|uniref:Polyketide synthase n=1 Tax=Wenjunlia vitaminophila TaxID=76728 RepID=A0A0T6LUD5_WENVI|nr:type I polyketide synthase [Wenjunlia vitaminophila]KRV49609.1 polyketide synthase [Wenjunlia vitaminophila]